MGWRRACWGARIRTCLNSPLHLCIGTTALASVSTCHFALTKQTFVSLVALLGSTPPHTQSPTSPCNQRECQCSKLLQSQAPMHKCPNANAQMPKCLNVQMPNVQLLNIQMLQAKWHQHSIVVFINCCWCCSCRTNSE